MSKFIEVEKFLEPYKTLEDSDIISIWLLKENLKQQPAADVVSREYFDSHIETYSNLLYKALTTIYKLLEIIRKENKEI